MVILNDRKISVKTKGIAKARDIITMESNNTFYIKCIPEYIKDLTNDDINNLYLSFLNLGKDIYNDYKDKIVKIKYNHYKFRDAGIYKPKELLSKDGNLITDEILNTIDAWKKQCDFYSEDNDSNYFFLRSYQDLDVKKISDWLKNNYISIEVEADFTDSKDPWVYVNYQRLIDMSVFIYLTSYSIRNAKKPWAPRKNINDHIEFSNFIETNNTKLNNNIKDFLPIIVDIIHMYELHNMNLLYGYNKLIWVDDNEYSRVEMTREYNDIFGVIWYVFKLYLMDNFSYQDKNGSMIPIRICDTCSNPFIGTNNYCFDCDKSRPAKRQRKTREKKKEKFEEIKSIIKNCRLPKDFMKEASEYINKHEKNINKCNVKDLENLYNKLSEHLKKANS